MKLTPKNQLTPDEAKRRAELEAIILPGLKDCIEVGAALKEMSDSRLYRSTHSTFREYVEETYKVSVRRAYELVEASEVVNALPENVRHGAHLNERQARALAKVPKKDRVEVLKRAKVHADLGKKPLTAKLIEQAAESVKPKPEPDMCGADPGEDEPPKPTRQDKDAIDQLKKLKLPKPGEAIATAENSIRLICSELMGQVEATAVIALLERIKREVFDRAQKQSQGSNAWAYTR